MREILEDHDASVDVFHVMEKRTDSMWSFQFDVSNVVGGTPSYTIMVSNIDEDESNFAPYNEDKVDRPLTEIGAGNSIQMRYWAIKYVANGATGTLTVFTDLKEDR